MGTDRVSTSRQFRNATPQDANRCFEIEVGAFHGDEAATLQKIAGRIANYPEGFVVLEVDGTIIGFINSACAFDVDLSEEDFKDLVGHDATAPNAVFLSVAVDPAYQGQRHATAMMREFVLRMREMGKQTIHLMCKDHHVSLYERFGYSYVKPSASQHGGARWHEMWMSI